MVVLTGLGFAFIYLQLKDAKKALSITTYENLYSRMHDIHKYFLENPELRDYFYCSKECKRLDVVTLQKLEIVAEMMADFFQQIHLQAAMMPPSTAKGWKNYIKTVVKNSPVLRAFLEKHKDWYPSNFVQIADATRAA